MSELSSNPAEAFVSLLTKHQPDLWAYILSLMPGNPDAADVLQNTNLVLWQKQDKFVLGSNFIAWSFSVARFEVLNHLKKQRRRGWVLLDEELLEIVADEAPKHLGAGDKRLAALEECLGRLRPRDRELLSHHYSSKIGLSDFSRTVGRSVSSLSVTLHRLRTALRRCVHDRLNAEGGLR